jgi:hypothetical protein
MLHSVAYRRWTGRRLARLAGQNKDTKAKLHAALALVNHDASAKDFLCQQMLRSDPEMLEVIRQALEPYKAELSDELWKTAQTDSEAQRRFNAACALASYAGDDAPGWEQLSGFVSRRLIETLIRSPRDFGVLIRLLVPVRLHLSSSLAPLVYDRQTCRFGEHCS